MTDRLFLAAALLLAPALATAQAPEAPGAPVAPAPASQTAAADAASIPESSTTGTFDFGGRLTSAVGDEARFERYRDSRDGVATGFTLNRQGRAYLFNAGASQIGYRDQRYNAGLLTPRVSAAFSWTSQPLNFSYITRTPYVLRGSALLLDDAAQAAVQGPTNAANDGTAVGVPCAPGAPPAACSNPSQVALALANRSIYNTFASPFDLRHERNSAAVGLTVYAARDIDVDAKFSSSGRTGAQPWGASFSFNNAVEIPLPLDQRTNDLTIGASWARPNAMFRLGWDGSWFNNDIGTIVWDNPIRLTDYSNGLLPPSGPFDPSGYSNGNGAAQGRMAVSPSNTMQVVSATGLYKFSRRTSVNGTLQLSSQKQNEPLIPWTSNSVIDSPVVFGAFPNLAQLPRPTAEAEATGINALLNLSARPTRRFQYTVRYRYNERDVQTPTFDATQYVRADATPSTSEHGLTHQFDTARHIFDAGVSFSPAPGWGSVRLGYGHEAVERHGRGFSDVGENILRLSYDAYTSQYLAVRTSVDVSRRRGEGYVAAQTGNDEDDAILGPGGTQPTLRYYDEADRDRRRGSILFTVMPHAMFDLFVQLAGGRDEYLPDDTPVSRPGELFGLLESSNTSWNAGLNVHPSDAVSFGASVGRDRYGSFQRSRNANPPPDPSWVDPARDWTLDNDDEISNASVYVDLVRVLRNTDVRIGYDYSDSNNSFVHGGPRITALGALGQFIPLPDVDNSWHSAFADVSYFFTSRIGLGASYSFERLEVVDFNTIDTDGPVGIAPATGYPRIDYLGGLITGYGNRPYTGQSGVVRLLYKF